VRLPAAYVAEHVDLGYATTTHRAQGITVDTSHTLGDPATSREAFYVAMTRGRRANHAYLTGPAATEGCNPDHVSRTLAADTRVILGAILANSQAELSATETLAQTTTQQPLAGQQNGPDEVPDRLVTRQDHAVALDGLSGPVAPRIRDDQWWLDAAARSARGRTHDPAGRLIG
jgi:hypothetical protein